MAIAPIAPYPMPGAAELPDNTVRWRIEPRRCVLLVHDMQHYFLAPYSADREPLTVLLHSVTALRDLCARLSVPVVYTAQPGSMSDEQRGLLKDFWGPGMSAAPEHRGIPDELRPGPADPVLTKWRASAFHRTELLDLMRRTGRDQLLICGVYGHVGVLLTACDAFANDQQAFVIADAIADFTPEFHRMTLDYVASRCGRVVVSAQVLAELSAAVEVVAR
ncbi:isochorismatase family protein [Nocardia sp. NPDC004604]|uniref:isochorismatase family protein n=1 Tax=Nocardia sp. NPDC004604 TaxID=3157013 RepID=UPI0033AB3FA4